MTRNVSSRAAANARNLAGPALRVAFRLEVFGSHHLPATGPLLIVGEQPELLAGPVIKAMAPRPIHVLAPPVAMAVVPTVAIAAGGDLVNAHPGIRGAEEALRILASGGAVALLGELPAVGYLAASSGAPVATVVVLGATGRVPTDPPPLRSRIEVRFGPVVPNQASGDPCSMAVIRGIGEQIRQQVADAQAIAWARHGGRGKEAQ